MLLGFDIGGTKCAVILGKADDANEAMHIIDKAVTPTNRTVYEMIELLFTMAESMLQKNRMQNEALQGIGISCGGPLNSKKGIVLSPPNLPGWDNIPIVELTQKRFKKNVLLQNDANAGAIAEWKYGAGKGFESLIFLTFGTGMGAGLILNGKLYSGATDLAGEVGHIRLAEMGPVGFGKAGSFEGFCSGGGIAQLAQIKVRQKFQMGEKVSFCNDFDDLPNLTAKTIADAAYKGDEVAIDIYKTCAEFLGRGLAVLIDIINPELIILGSIYGRARSLIEPHMRRILSEEAISESYKNCQIVSPGLSENIGDMAALALARESMNA